MINFKNTSVSLETICQKSLVGQLVQNLKKLKAALPMLRKVDQPLSKSYSQRIKKTIFKA